MINHNKLTRLSLAIGLCVFVAFQGLAQRTLGMEGSPNFRELGGIQVQSGQKVKEGKIYRSGVLTHLTEEDMAKFRETGITTIIDLRSDFEIEHEPDAFPEDMGITRVHAPIGSMDQSGMMKFMTALADPDFNEAMADELMIEANLGFANTLQDFKPIFDHMLKGEAILFHCSAGKDRTGLASAMILHILGANEQEIKKDFLRSNDNIGLRSKNGGTAFGIPDDKIALLAGVKEPYLVSAIEAINAKYGSLDKALETEFGLTTEKIQVIRKLYLE